MNREKNRSSSSATFKIGAISLAFLIIGYQSANFIRKAAGLLIEAHRDRPDTVYVVDETLAARLLGAPVPGEKDMAGPSASTHPGKDDGARDTARSGRDGWRTAPTERNDAHAVPAGVTIRHEARHSEAVMEIRRAGRKVENFPFNPNTISAGDLQRLGFSEKQAAAICNYRSKGGRFRRKSDFAKSFVVADSVYARLEPYIVIPLLDINKADSAEFDALPGIGPYFAAKMVEYREKIGGYTSTEQLMDIRSFDRERYDGLCDLITCGDGD